MTRGDKVILQPLTHTLLDLKGSVSVSGPQDFDSIRKKVPQGHCTTRVDTKRIYSRMWG